CPSQADYAESIAMRDGVSVYGGYQATGNAWPRVATCVTRILDQSHNGVAFDATIKSTTVLGGFTILGHADPTSAAVTVAGATGAVITDDAISGAGTMTSYGV